MGVSCVAETCVAHAAAECATALAVAVSLVALSALLNVMKKAVPFASLMLLLLLLPLWRVPAVSTWLEVAIRRHAVAVVSLSGLGVYCWNPFHVHHHPCRCR